MENDRYWVGSTALLYATYSLLENPLAGAFGHILRLLRYTRDAERACRVSETNHLQVCNYVRFQHKHQAHGASVNNGVRSARILHHAAC
jgi:hypothetical protein